ncbi:MAG TPA: O-antigen ligase family protein [Candidatus Saccharimonadales bacterium]|nr:O-antigen ligase family protein [Candidatus Saccharimonadales bacterium]
MRTTFAETLSGAQGQRRLAAALIVGGVSLFILVPMAVLGVGLPILGAALVLGVAAAATVVVPEVGLGLLIVNALVGLTHITDLPTLGPLSIPIAFEGVLALSFAFQVAVGRRKFFLGSAQHALILLLTLWVVVSLLVSGNVHEENLEALRNLVLVRVLIFVLLTNILWSEASLRRLVGLITVSNVGLVAASIATRLGVFGAEKQVISQRMLRTSALVQNPNNLAFDLTTMLILAVFTYLYVRSRWLKGLMLALAVVDAGVILSTLSRSGFISLVVVLVFMFFKLPRRTRLVAASLIVFLGLGLVAGSNIVKRFERINQLREVDRYKLAMVGLNASTDNPFFGVGLGNYLRHFDEYNNQQLKRPMPTHNMYVNLAAEMGLPALLLYLGLLATTWWGLRRMDSALKRSGRSGSFDHIFNVAAQCFLVNLCVFGLSGDVEFEYSVFIMLGFAALLHHRWSRGIREDGEAVPAVQG